MLHTIRFTATTCKWREGTQMFERSSCFLDIGRCLPCLRLYEERLVENGCHIEETYPSARQSTLCHHITNLVWDETHYPHYPKDDLHLHKVRGSARSQS